MLSVSQTYKIRIFDYLIVFFINKSIDTNHLMPALLTILHLLLYKTYTIKTSHSDI